MSGNPSAFPCSCEECSRDSEFLKKLIPIFTKATAMRESNLLHANWELNIKQYEDELGSDDNERVIEGLSETNKTEPGVTYMNKAGDFFQTNGRKKQSRVYIIGEHQEYDNLVAASEKDRSSAVAIMQTACSELGFHFNGYIMEATRVHFFPGIVNLTYVGLYPDLNRYMFEKDLGSFHPLFIVLPK